MAADAKPTTCGMLAIKANELKAKVAIVLSLHGCSHAILPVFNAIDFTPQWTLSNVAQAGFAQPRDGYSGGFSFSQAEGTTMKDAAGGEGSAVEETAKSHVPPTPTRSSGSTRKTIPRSQCRRLLRSGFCRYGSRCYCNHVWQGGDEESLAVKPGGYSHGSEAAAEGEVVEGVAAAYSLLRDFADEANDTKANAEVVPDVAEEAWETTIIDGAAKSGVDAAAIATCSLLRDSAEEAYATVTMLAGEEMTRDGDDCYFLMLLWPWWILRRRRYSLTRR